MQSFPKDWNEYEVPPLKEGPFAPTGDSDINPFQGMYDYVKSVWGTAVAEEWLQAVTR